MAAAAHNTSSQRVVQKMEQPPADSGKQKERALSSPGRRVRATLSSRERSDTAPTKTAATSSSVEWPLLESPALSRMQVTGFEMLNGSVYYVVDVFMADVHWTVVKSHDEFLEMHRELVDTMGLEYSLFPQKPWFGGMKKEKLFDMQSKLDLYLIRLMKYFTHPPRPLLDFLEYRYNDILSITEVLSELFYYRGDEFLATNSTVAFSPLQLHCVCQRLVIPIQPSDTTDPSHEFGHLLEFLQHLKRLKVCPPTRELFTLAPSVDLTFDLSMMKSLDTLVLYSLDLSKVGSLGELPSKLVILGANHSATEIKDVMYLCHNGSTDSRSWPKLKVVDLSYNNLTSIDESLKCAPNLEDLNLSHNCIQEVDNLLVSASDTMMHYPHLRVLDLSFNQIKSLEGLNHRLGNIATLCLAGNQLVSLEGIEKLYSVICLDVQSNHIEDVNEMCRLIHMPCLEQLMIKGNPFTQSPSYRAQVFSMVGKLADKVAVDGKPASKDELEVSMFKARRKRGSQRTVDITAEIDENVPAAAPTNLPSVSVGTRRHMEQMRKEGGADWLTIYNQRVTDQGTPGSGSSRTKRKHKHKKRREDLESSGDSAAVTPQESGPIVVAAEVALASPSSGQPSSLLQGLVDARADKLQSPWTCTVSVLEYPGAFHQLSKGDIDQLVTTRPLEPCTITVDLSMDRITEQHGSGSLRRSQRDLSLMKEIRVHEGRSLAIALYLPSFGQQLWVLYCVPGQDILADLYAMLMKRSTLQQKHKSKLASPIISPHHGGAVAGQGTVGSDGGGGDDQSPSSSEPTSLSTCTSDAKPTEPVSVSLTSSELHDDHEESAYLDAVTDTQAITSPSNNNADVENGGMTEKKEKDQKEMFEEEDIAVDVTDGDLLKVDQGREGEKSLVTSDYETPSSSPLPPPDPVEEITPTRRRRRLPDSLTITVKGVVLQAIRDKPGLDSQKIQDYFTTCLAQERGEVLMYVLWCSALLPCTTPNELEVAVMISSMCVYLVEVQSPTQQQEAGTSWTTSNLPLNPVLNAHLDHISKIIVVGIFDQNVLVELHDKSPLRSFVLFPPTKDLSEQIVQQFKAALDAYGLHYTLMTAKQMGDSKGMSGVAIVTPDSSSMAKLQKRLARDKTVTRLSNFIATHKNKKLLGSFEVELQTSITDRAQKIQVAQQLVVNAVSADLLPFTTGRISLKPLNLILTSEHIFLCEEHFLFHHLLQTSALKQAFPCFQMVSSWPISAITGVQMCDKSQVLRSHSDLVYEFTISFKSGETKGGDDEEPCEAHWLLSVHNQAYLARFFECLKKAWRSIHNRELPLTYTTLLLPQFHRYHRLATASDPLLPSVSTPLKSPSSRHKPQPPVFIRSHALLYFTSLTHSARLRLFKDHFALANFLKSDETIISLFLAHCQPPMEKREVEVCVLVSNYAVYFLSDQENIRVWLDAGGVSSFTRMSLLNPDNNSDLQCFFRMWLNDLAKVRVGLLHLCVRLSDSKKESNIDINTGNLHSTMSMLAAIASILHLQDPTLDKQTFDFLSDFVDVTEDTSYSETASGAVPVNPSKRPVDFVLPTAKQLSELMVRLVDNTPALTQTSSVKNCADSMQILHHQVMLLAEQVRHKDHEYLHYRPHLALLTNYGLYLCANSASPELSPCPFSPSHLSIKKEKWMRIDAIQHVRVGEDEQFGVLQLFISVRSGVSAASRCLVPQNTQLGNIFLHFLSLLWRERMGQQLPIHYM